MSGRWAVAVLALGTSAGPSVRDAPPAVYSADRQDPWNRIHHLLFSRRVPTRVEGPAPGAGTTSEDLERAPWPEGLAQYYHRFRAVSRTVERQEGEDVPDFERRPDVEFLLESSRYARLVQALQQELASPRLAGRRLEARVLFQQDLWERFDRIHALPEPSPDARRLLTLVGRLIARVALPAADLRAVRSNLAEIARAHPGLLDAGLLAGPSRWRELRARFRDDRASTTAHARTAGFRRVFRVFVDVPERAGGVDCLAGFLVGAHGGRPEALAHPCAGHWGLPDGTRVLLVETLVAVSAEGDPVPLPIVVAVEGRTMGRPRPGPDGRFGLEDLPFAVLHASRLALSSGTGAALTLLAADHPVPQFVGCVARESSTALVPARLACAACHGLDGRRLMVDAFHGLAGIDAAAVGGTLAADDVVRAKRAQPAFQALREYFGPGRRLDERP